MPAECNSSLFDVAGVEGRVVVASFESDKTTSNAGALLLGAANHVLGVSRRLAALLQGSV